MAVSNGKLMNLGQNVLEKLTGGKILNAKAGNSRMGMPKEMSSLPPMKSGVKLGSPKIAKQK